ncbi:MAG: DUF1217 domain-containing protein [Sulfitobacter sp.]
MFQPVVLASGLAGWRFLQRTYDQQFEAFTSSTLMQRDTEYFRENIGNIKSAEELVSDRRLLNVALTAFGLQDDLNNRYFIRKVLEEGSVGDDALANRFSDGRYAELSKAFGFGPLEFPQWKKADFASTMISRFESAEFEIATGQQDESMRIALYAQRELGALAAQDSSVDTKWYSIMGDQPLREVFEKALNLPEGFGQMDIDRQLTVFKSRARSVFGSDDPSIFTDETKMQDALTKFILRDQLDGVTAGMSSGSIALTLLGG